MSPWLIVVGVIIQPDTPLFFNSLNTTLGYNSIFIVAAEMEAWARDFYQSFYDQIDDEEVKHNLEKAIKLEDAHHREFTKIAAELSNMNNIGAIGKAELGPQGLAILDNINTLRDGMPEINSLKDAKITNMLEFAEFGCQLEKGAVDLYKEFITILPSKFHMAIKKILKEEEKHHIYFEDLLVKLKRTSGK